MQDHENDTRELIVDEPEPAPLEEGWNDEEELPPRPRRRLLTPLTGALLGVLVAALGFIGGVLVQKGQEGSAASSGATGGLGARAAGLRAAGGLASGAGAIPGGGRTGATVGQVTFIQGSTLYVETTEGTTVKVKTSAGSSVTKSVKGTVAGIRPGETVIVTGAKSSNGSVQAESIRVGAASAGAGLGALFGGSRSTGAGSSGASSSGSGGEPQLFGRGG